MEIKVHGGGCCGVRHIQGFLTPTERGGGRGPCPCVHCQRVYDKDPEKYPMKPARSRQEHFAELIEEFKGLLEPWKTAPTNMVLEAYITDNQALIWEETLLKEGFVKLYRFKNSNSNNYVNLYVYCRDGEKI